MLRPPLHTPQIEDGYCVPACARMALSQFGIDVSLEHLAKNLGVRKDVGVPLSSLKRLEDDRIGVEVTSVESVDELRAMLDSDKAVIALLVTVPEMEGWEESETTVHTVLVVEAMDDLITYHDPHLDYGPVSVGTDAFLLGWVERDNTCALFSRKEV